jgi:hypothetical protein
MEEVGESMNLIDVETRAKGEKPVPISTRGGVYWKMSAFVMLGKSLPLTLLLALTKNQARNGKGLKINAMRGKNWRIRLDPYEIATSPPCHIYGATYKRCATSSMAISPL